ncbi:MAG TPA: hypothetical protein P5079_09640 [Elusimicrobiota bacterium]|nr:hypothetical protein [Elusimicrobiota bacterium]
MNERFLELARRNEIFPQSADLDLADRLIRRSMKFFAAASRPRSASSEETTLFCYLALTLLLRSWLAAKGYRPRGGDSGGVVGEAVGAMPGSPAEEIAKVYGDLRSYWVAGFLEPDMPLPVLSKEASLRGSRRLAAALRRRMVKEFPGLKKSFGAGKKEAPFASPERTFRGGGAPARSAGSAKKRG